MTKTPSLHPTCCMVEGLPLCPIHSTKRTLSLIQPINQGPIDIESQSIRRNELLLHFWKRWRQEYLTSLREFHKCSGKNETEIKVGDVVQVHDDTKRVNWRLAIIESLIYGNDGMVRAANIKTSTGYTNRPITKLYPLEVTSTTHRVEKTRNPRHSD